MDCELIVNQDLAVSVVQTNVLMYHLESMPASAPKLAARLHSAVDLLHKAAAAYDKETTAFRLADCASIVDHANLNALIEQARGCTKNQNEERCEALCQAACNTVQTLQKVLGNIPCPHKKADNFMAMMNSSKGSEKKPSAGFIVGLQTQLQQQVKQLENMLNETQAIAKKKFFEDQKRAVQACRTVVTSYAMLAVLRNPESTATSERSTKYKSDMSKLLLDSQEQDLQIHETILAKATELTAKSSKMAPSQDGESKRQKMK
jgi:hypothetical protein